MGRFEIWASLGTGLVMTFLGIIFEDHAVVLLILAAVCYAMALLLWLRSRRTAKEKFDPPQLPKGGIGILSTNNTNCTFTDVRSEGYKNGIVEIGGQGNKWISPRIRKPRSPEDRS
jgi:hypothetical protein